MSLDITTTLIAIIGGTCTLASGIIGYITQRERKLVMDKFKGLIALVQVNNIKLDLVINSLSQINGESKVGDKFKHNYNWMYDQKEATIKEYERQAASIVMDL